MSDLKNDIGANIEDVDPDNIVAELKSLRNDVDEDKQEDNTITDSSSTEQEIQEINEQKINEKETLIEKAQKVGLKLVPQDDELPYSQKLYEKIAQDDNIKQTYHDTFKKEYERLSHIVDWSQYEHEEILPEDEGADAFEKMSINKLRDKQKAEKLRQIEELAAGIAQEQWIKAINDRMEETRKSHPDYETSKMLEESLKTKHGIQLEPNDIKAKQIIMAIARELNLAEKETLKNAEKKEEIERKKGAFNLTGGGARSKPTRTMNEMERFFASKMGVSEKEYFDVGGMKTWDLL